MATSGGVLIKALISQLADDGEKAIRQAYEGREFTNRTYNLHDSYGSAVYYNGTLVKSSIRYIGAEMAKEADWRSQGWIWKGSRTMPDFRGKRRLNNDEVLMNGREEVMDFFSHYKPKNRKGIDLVIIAAMFYADILEEGKGKLKRKYKVISEGEDYMREVASRFNGTLSKLVKARDLSVMTTIKDKSWAQ